MLQERKIGNFGTFPIYITYTSQYSFEAINYYIVTDGNSFSY